MSLISFDVFRRCIPLSFNFRSGTSFVEFPPFLANADLMEPANCITRDFCGRSSS